MKNEIKMVRFTHLSRGGREGGDRKYPLNKQSSLHVLYTLVQSNMTLTGEFEGNI